MAAFSSTKATILLLSSEPQIRAALRDALANAGYLVLPARDLGEAVDALSRGPVDLLVTHPYIASMPGNQAAKYLRQRDNKMAVLIMAGLLDDDRYMYRAQLENFSVFPPPVTSAQLIAEVQKILNAKRQREAAESGRSDSSATAV